MTKKTWSLLLTGALIAGVFSAVPAQAAPVVPATPNVTDMKGDANFINDGTIPVVGGKGTATPTDASSLGDIMAGWFTVAGDKLNAHIQVEAPPPGGNGAAFNVYAAPGEGEAGSSTLGCVRFWLVIPGTNPGGGSYQGAPIAKMHDRCNTGGNIYSAPDIEYTIDALEDGTGVITLTSPRDLSPLFADGQVLAGPSITSHSPALGQTTGPSQSWAVVTPSTDNTAIGTDFVVTSGGAPTAPPVVSEPPVQEPGQGNQNCAKIKNKKEKKACKKNSGKTPPGDKCAAYTPGELGAEAETTVVTEAATEEAPIEIEIAMDPAAGKVGPYDESARVSHNVQLDSVGSEAGLFMRLETPETDDPDLYAYWNDGSEAAVAGGFNQGLVAGPVPGPAGPTVNGSGNAGESGFGYEQINGLRTADCAGWDLDLVNWAGIGGTYTLKLWVGEIQNDPTAPAKAVK